jgi:putative DNA primase/helicase
MKTVEAARGRWKGIITMLGVDPKFLEDRHQECPFCGGKDRYRFDDKGGSGSFFCSGCGAGNGMDFVMRLRSWEFAEAAREVDALIGRVRADESKPERSAKDKSNALRRLLEESRRLAPGSPAWTYLERRCGSPVGIQGDLWEHPGLKHGPSGEVYPALLAILRYETGTAACVHRTYLTTEGFKAPVDPVRMMMPAPAPLAGSAIRLGTVAERLGISEGLETAICAGKMFGLPVWSAIAANLMTEWVPPSTVCSVVVFGDNDRSYTGQAAAFELARKLRVKGLDVEVQIPLTIGADWADCWMNL